MRKNIIVGSTFTFDLKARKWPQLETSKKMKPTRFNHEAIALPSPFHSWEKTVCNLDSTTINDSGEFFAGPQEGECNLEVYDSSITSVMSK